MESRPLERLGHLHVYPKMENFACFEAYVVATIVSLAVKAMLTSKRRTASLPVSQKFGLQGLLNVTILTSSLQAP
jgi:hypothetical protein